MRIRVFHGNLQHKTEKKFWGIIFLLEICIGWTVKENPDSLKVIDLIIGKLPIDNVVFFRKTMKYLTARVKLNSLVSA